MNKFLIGIGHRKGTGKNTFGIFLADAFADIGVQAYTISFAYPLKKLAQQFFEASPPSYYEYDREAKDRHKLPCGLTPRELFIKIGMGFREIDENVWVNAAIAQTGVRPAVWIFTDLRFPNEAARMDYTIRIDRDVPRSDDGADEPLQGYKFSRCITNDGDKDILACKASVIAHDLKGFVQ